MYNPLKYVDPSGERCVGGIISGYLLEQAYRELMIMRYNNYLEIMEPTWERMNWLINSIYSVGDSSAGALSNNNHGGSGNHGSPIGGGRSASTSFNRFQQNQPVDSDEGRCILTSLGSIWGGDSTAVWEERAKLYREIFDKNPFDPNNLVEFINWNPDPDVYTSYTCEGIYMSDICDAMNDGYVVSAMCDFTANMIDYYGFNNNGHFVNVSYISIQDDGWVNIEFNDHPMNTFMHDYNANQIECFDYSRYTTYNYNTGNRIRILESIHFIKIKLWP